MTGTKDYHRIPLGSHCCCFSFTKANTIKQSVSLPAGYSSEIWTTPSSSWAFNMRYYPSVPCGFPSDRSFLSQNIFDFFHFISVFSMFRAPGISTPDWLPIEAGGLYGGSLYFWKGKVRKILVSMVQAGPKVWVRISGRKGPPFLYPRPPSVPEKLPRTTLPYSGLPKFHIGQENSHPQFGIIMMHLRCRHVVRFDFCCLLSCCYLSIRENHHGLQYFQSGLELGFGVLSALMSSPGSIS